mmetsp:Transcript_24481/g.34025  ORF Transcript_24481/g.34025 Transcript_24481/m.34025 type:complete len:264 (+) Transcript_24481:66-857(+)|eukprot:jgi/Bigna1/90903/estExt_fgenesh1_pg.C_820056
MEVADIRGSLRYRAARRSRLLLGVVACFAALGLVATTMNSSVLPFSPLSPPLQYNIKNFQEIERKLKHEGARLAEDTRKTLSDEEKCRLANMTSGPRVHSIYKGDIGINVKECLHNSKQNFRSTYNITAELRKDVARAKKQSILVDDSDCTQDIAAIADGSILASAPARHMRLANSHDSKGSESAHVAVQSGLEIQDEGISYYDDDSTLKNSPFPTSKSLLVDVLLRELGSQGTEHISPPNHFVENSLAPVNDDDANPFPFSP